MISQRQPRLFIGCSKEAAHRVAPVVANVLSTFCAVQQWNQGAFHLNESTLEGVLKLPERYDFAVFIFSGDDAVVSRDQTEFVPRDNVLFEFGYFMGCLGRTRVLPLVQSGIKLLSDLKGITVEMYSPHDHDGVGAPHPLRQACENIRRHIELHWAEVPESPRRYDAVDAVETYEIGNHGALLLSVLRRATEPKLKFRELAQVVFQFENRIKEKHDFSRHRREWKAFAKAVCECLERKGLVNIDKGHCEITQDGRELFERPGFVKTYADVFEYPPMKIRKAGAICWKPNRGRVQFLLLCTKGKNRWSVPKGNVERGRSTAWTAENETAEETGVLGHLEPEALLEFIRPKGAKSRTEEEWSLFMMRYLKVNKRVIKGEAHDHRWFSYDEAREHLSADAPKSLRENLVRALDLAHKKIMENTKELCAGFDNQLATPGLAPSGVPAARKNAQNT